MCFSAHASFGAAAILSVLGIAALKKNKNPPMAPIAAVPLFFGIQQALEGFLWITVNHGGYPLWLYYISMYGFMFFASVWWPLYIPSVLYYLEQNQDRKKLLQYIIGIAACVPIVAIINFVCGHGIYAESIAHHMSYNSYTLFPYASVIYGIGLIAYLIAIVGALYVSTIPYTGIMSALIVIAYMVAQIFYYYAFGSIWCFLAALCSLLIIYMM